jgi:hypothetical protein
MDGWLACSTPRWLTASIVPMLCTDREVKEQWRSIVGALIQVKLKEQIDGSVVDSTDVLTAGWSQARGSDSVQQCLSAPHNVHKQESTFSMKTKWNSHL